MACLRGSGELREGEELAARLLPLCSGEELVEGCGGELRGFCGMEGW